jgi:hypothetical protein
LLKGEVGCRKKSKFGISLKVVAANFQNLLEKTKSEVKALIIYQYSS